MDRIETIDTNVFPAFQASVVFLTFSTNLATCQIDHVLTFIFLEHTSQYFSIIVTLSPTSKQASMVARLPHVEQCFNFFSFGPCTKGFSEIRDFVIYFQLPMSAIIKDTPITAPPIIKNFVLLLVIVP